MKLEIIQEPKKDDSVKLFLMKDGNAVTVVSIKNGSKRTEAHFYESGKKTMIDSGHFMHDGEE